MCSLNKTNYIVLGPLLFVIFINDLDINVMSKFADNTKLGHTVITDEDQALLQHCISNLLEWAKMFCMSEKTTGSLSIL